MNDELDKALAECAGHTPGPWKQYGLKVWSGVEYIADTAKDGWVKECKANARLIALAPTPADWQNPLRRRPEWARRKG